MLTLASCISSPVKIAVALVVMIALLDEDQWPVSRKSRELFEPENPFLKLRSAYFKKLVFYFDFKIQKGNFFLPNFMPGDVFVFELFCVNKIALCQHEAQEILPWSDEWMVWFCLEPMN